MTGTTDRARRYLLGEATPEEVEALELAMLRSEETVAAVAATEDDLIEEHLDGRAAPEVRERFERHYLASPVHARRVAVVRELRRRAGRRAVARRILPLFALAAVVVLGIVAVIQRDGPIVLSIPAVAERSAGTAPTLDLGDGTRAVELRLERLDGVDGTPAAVVRTVEGDAVWSGTAEAEGPAWKVALPAGTLRPGDFLLEIGEGPLQRGYFRVVSP